ASTESFPLGTIVSMQLIAFDRSNSVTVIKTALKYIQMLRGEEGEIKFKDMTCQHRGGPLTHGLEDDNWVTCPWHGRKTRKCHIRYLDIPYVENRKTVWVGLQDFERLIKNV
ncbi:Rieske (2Fe-2S) protein, partial [Pseudomonas sp. AB12(2023)]